MKERRKTVEFTASDSGKSAIFRLIREIFFCYSQNPILIWRPVCAVFLLLTGKPGAGFMPAGRHKPRQSPFAYMEAPIK